MSLFLAGCATIVHTSGHYLYIGKNSVRYSYYKNAQITGEKTTFRSYPLSGTQSANAQSFDLALASRKRKLTLLEEGQDGNATIITTKGKIYLPLVPLKAKHGIGDPSITPAHPVTLNYSKSFVLPNSLTMDWVTTQYYNGQQLGLVFLVPLGWQAVNAVVGADGSVNIKLRSKNSPTESMLVQDDGGCNGCSVSDTATFFPGMRKWAKNLGMYFPSSIPSNLSIHKLTNNSELVSFRAPGNSNLSTGVVYSSFVNNPNGKGDFQMITLTVPADFKLRNEILNFFMHYITFNKL